MKMISILVHGGDVRSGILHPASSTHRQLSDAELVAAGINPGTMRLSVGIESAADIIADLTQALA